MTNGPIRPPAPAKGKGQGTKEPPQTAVRGGYHYAPDAPERWVFRSCSLNSPGVMPSSFLNTRSRMWVLEEGSSTLDGIPEGGGDGRVGHVAITHVETAQECGILGEGLAPSSGQLLDIGQRCTGESEG